MTEQIHFKIIDDNKVEINLDDFKYLIAKLDILNEKAKCNERVFTYLNYSKDGYIGSFFCNDKPLTNKEIVDLLNKLADENEQLKQQLNNFKEIIFKDTTGKDIILYQKDEDIQ